MREFRRIINMVILMPKYQFAQANHLMLPQPRYPLFVVYWFVTLFLLTYILTWAYVSVRNVFGPGPITALRVGFLIGFVMSFPSVSRWRPGRPSAALSCWVADARPVGGLNPGHPGLRLAV